MDISPDITMIDTILSGMIQSPTFDHSETDTKFTACVIRDAVSLPDTESEYARRKHMFYSVLIGGHGEVWKVVKLIYQMMWMLFFGEKSGMRWICDFGF